MSRQYKLLAFDLDGTLLAEDNILSDRLKKNIKKAKKKGVEVVIATGRMFVSAKPFARELALQGPLVSYNGALIKEISTGQQLFHKPVPLKLAREILQECREKGLHLNVYVDDKLYVAKANDFSRAYEQATGVSAHVTGPLLDFLEKAPTKLLAIETDREQQQYFLQYFQEKYQDRLAVTESKKHFIEFVAKEASKGLALKFLSDYYGISRKQVLAAGDSWNDLSMIEWAGTGVAISSADQDIKKKADIIADTPEEDGIARLIEKDIL